MKRAVLLCIAAACANVSHAVEIYNNGPVVNSAGKSVVASGSTTYGYAANSSATVADDFTIDAGKTWNISSIDFFSYQTGATGFTFGNANWSIVEGDVATGNVVASGSTAVTDGGRLGYRVLPTAQNGTTRPIYRVQADVADFSLAQGHYWLRWSLTGSLASGPWVATTSDWRTGNANQDIGLGFRPLVDAGTQKSVELPFVINGTIAAVPEPETYAMMLGGLAMLGAFARRRRQQAA